MNWKKIARSLVCLLVVCALIVNMVPARAEAFAAEALGVLGFIAVLTAAYAGAPLILGSDENYSDVGNAFSTYLQAWGAANGKSDAVNDWLTDATLGWTDGYRSTPLGIPAAIAVAIAQWVYDLVNGDAEIQVGGAVAPSGYKYYNGVLLPVYPSRSGSYKYLVRYSSGTIYLYSSDKLLHYNESTNSVGALNDSITASYYFCYLKQGSSEWVIDPTKRSKSQGIIDCSAAEVFYSNHIIPIVGKAVNVEWWMDPGVVSDSSGVALVPDTLIGDVAPGLADGSKDPDDIYIPPYLDMSQVLQYGDTTGSGSVSQAMNDLVSGDLSLDDYQAMFPCAVMPQININLTGETFTYEKGAAARPFVINAEPRDGGTLSYQWYRINPDDFVDIAIEGATSPKFIPSTAAVGTIQYYCRVTSTAANDTKAYIDTLANTVTIVEPGTITDTSTGAVTQGGLQSALSGLAADIGTWFTGVIDAVKSIPQAIVDGIAAIFVPSDGYIQSKVAALGDKYFFVSSIVESGSSLLVFLNGLGSKPPIIYIDLSVAESNYDWGGKAIALDMTWYARYKPTVDSLLSAFLWLWFIWRLLLSLPGIITGTSGFWGSPDPLAGYSPIEFVPRLGSGGSHLLGTSEYRQRGVKGRHYIKDGD